MTEAKFLDEEPAQTPVKRKSGPSEENPSSKASKAPSLRGKVDYFPEKGAGEEVEPGKGDEDEDDVVVDRKGKGIAAKGDEEEKGDGKGKGDILISCDDYEFDNDVCLDSDDAGDSDDSDTDDTEGLLRRMESDEYLSGGPLAEADLGNILPLKTRYGEWQC